MSLVHSKGAALDYANGQGKTPLMIAIAFHRHGLISYLVEHGANLHARDGTGMSMLHIVSWYGHLAVLEYLLKQQACPGVLQPQLQPYG